MTKQLPLKKEAILPRIDGIQKNIKVLRELGILPDSEFFTDAVQDRAHHNLRLALEGVFNMTAHILSRIPGARATEYKQMALKLGEAGVVDREFAKTKLFEMGGFRNRLTHFYAEVTANELANVIRNDLGDIEKFLGYMKALLEHPDKFGLAVE